MCDEIKSSAYVRTYDINIPSIYIHKIIKDKKKKKWLWKTCLKSNRLERSVEKKNRNVKAKELMIYRHITYFYMHIKRIRIYLFILTAFRCDAYRLQEEKKLLRKRKMKQFQHNLGI